MAPEPSRGRTGFIRINAQCSGAWKFNDWLSAKSHLIETGRLHDEIERLLGLPEFSGRQAELFVQRSEHEVIYRVRDQGSGLTGQAFSK